MSTTLGERLRILRKARGLSQEAVARRAEIGLRAYGDLERGRASDPHYSTLEGIAYALNTTVAELVSEEPELVGTGKGEAPPDTGFVVTTAMLEEIAKLWNLPPSEASALLEYLLRTGFLSESELQEAREEGVRRELATGASR